MLVEVGTLAYQVDQLISITLSHFIHIDNRVWFKSPDGDNTLHLEWCVQLPDVAPAVDDQDTVGVAVLDSFDVCHKKRKEAASSTGNSLV